MITVKFYLVSGLSEDANIWLSIILSLVDLILCFVIASAAKNIGGSYGKYFWSSFFLTPIYGGLSLLFLKKKIKRQIVLKNEEAALNARRLETQEKIAWNEVYGEEKPVPEIVLNTCHSMRLNEFGLLAYLNSCMEEGIIKKSQFDSLFDEYMTP